MITKHHLAIFIYPYHIHITTIRTSSDHLTAGPAAIAAPQRSATCSLRPGPTAGGGVDFSWDFKWISEESMGYHGKFTEIRGISWGLTSILLLILSNVWHIWWLNLIELWTMGIFPQQTTGCSSQLHFWPSKLSVQRQQQFFLLGTHTW